MSNQTGGERGYRLEGHDLKAQKIGVFSGSLKHKWTEHFSKPRGIDSNDIELWVSDMRQRGCLLKHDVEVARSVLKGIKSGMLFRGWHSVNFSIEALIDSWAVASLAALARQFLSLESCLVIEISEKFSVADYSKAVLSASALRSQGALVALDDFDCGLPHRCLIGAGEVDVIKIAHLSALCSSDVCYQTKLARVLRPLDVVLVIEGIESETQLIRALDLGADAVQGYQISVPSVWFSSE